MLRKVRFRRPSAPTLIALLALFVAMGSNSALANFIIGSNSQVGPNTISGHHPPAGDHANIIRGSLAGQDLANGAVTTSKLATGAVTETKVASAIKDRAANIPSLRTLGTGALQAMPGNATPGGPPTGPASGDLTGNYPNPLIAPGAVTTAKLTDGAVTGGKIAAKTLTGANVADNSLTGSQIDASTLGKVPSATNADQLGGAAASSYQATCETGAVLATGRVAASGSFSSTFTSTGVSDSFSCPGPAGTTITARRVAQGDYRVCFPHAGTMPLVGDASFNDFVSVDLAIHDATCDGQEYKVTTRDASGNGQDEPFMIVLF